MEADENTIRDALLRLLKGHNIEPRECWTSIRVFPNALHRSTPCTVVIAYPPAKAALCEVLNFLSGGQEDETDRKAGIWVLTQAQAQYLCNLIPHFQEEQREGSIRTLGDVLYADKAKSLVSETDWRSLVQSIAGEDQLALHALYERTHLIVFTLIGRITNNHATAEQVSLDVFHAVWRRASIYDPAQETVLGWVMNQARSSATDRLRLEERKRLRRRIDSCISWPNDTVRPPASLRERLAQRIAAETGGETVMPGQQHWEEPEWKEVAPGISCKLLATDMERHRVSMLVRLAPGADYPPHTHVGVEELHLLCGELWINDRKLYPGDYNRAEAGTSDKRVWSETGCTCVLITSARDLLTEPASK